MRAPQSGNRRLQREAGVDPHRPEQLLRTIYNLVWCARMRSEVRARHHGAKRYYK